MPARTGPPETAGRWALLPALDTDPTRRAHAAAEALLDRHGVVTRGAVVSERMPGGFAARLQGALGVRGVRPLPPRLLRRRPRRRPVRHRRRVDRLRTLRRGSDARRQAGRAVALAATDPANPYGAALPWPDRGRRRAAASAAGHRPGRKAGALVVLVDGALALYVERGGRTLLTWTDDPAVLTPAAESLAAAVRRGALGRLTVEKADGEQLLGSGATRSGPALQDAGFVATPRGLRLRA